MGLGQLMGSMSKKVGSTRHVKCAGKTPVGSQDKWTTLEDMYMLHVSRSRDQATSSPDSFPDEGLL